MYKNGINKLHKRLSGVKHRLTPPTYFQGVMTPLTPMIYALALHYRV